MADLPMNTVEIIQSDAKNRKIYANLYKRFGHSHDSLHWSSRDAQRKRFEVMAQIAPLHHLSVLDIGCGFGDFFGYLKNHNITVEYHGWDLVQEFVTVAQKTYPEARFDKINPLLTRVNRKFDYVFMCGIFAFGDLNYFRSLMVRAVELAAKGIVFNVHLTKNKEFLYLPPDLARDELSQMGLTNIKFIDDYVKDDYSCFVYL